LGLLWAHGSLQPLLPSYFGGGESEYGVARACWNKAEAVAPGAGAGGGEQPCRQAAKGGGVRCYSVNNCQPRHG